MLPNTHRWEMIVQESEKTILDSVLHNRGIYSADEKKVFLSSSTKQLFSPYLLKDMDKAIERIQKARMRQELIVIYGDYDVDGITSTAILYNFLKSTNHQVSYYIPNRKTEGYGLNIEALRKIREYATLVITVDTGIAAVEEVEFANKIGLEIIITDHHECQASLPKAYCILNPKLPTNTYPFEYLAGVGVTFKLIHALAITYGIEKEVWQYLDSVAVGTVADVVPLIGENRTLVALGFRQLEKTNNYGLKHLLALVQKDKNSNRITSYLIAYQIGPRMNAVGRLSDAKLGVELLTTKEENKARELAERLDEENKQRQEIEAFIIAEALAYIEEYINEEEEKILVVIGKNWHPGVIGIVASKILSKYYKPTIVLTEEDGVLSGSARSIEGFNIFEALTAVKEHLVRFGGHEMAAGLTLSVSNKEDFIYAITSYAKEKITKEMLIPRLCIDKQIKLNNLSLELYEQLEKLEPFGNGNPTPLFSLKATIYSIQKIGYEKQHLKIILTDGKLLIEGIGFQKGYLYEYLTEGEEVVVAGEIIKNTWRERTTIQLKLVAICSPKRSQEKSQFYKILSHVLAEPVQLEKIEQNFKKDNNLLNGVQKICYNKVCSQNNGMSTYIFSEAILNAKKVGANDVHSIKEIPLISLVPCYEDCIATYKLLRNYSEDKLAVHKAITLLKNNNMNEYKLFQILNIFQDLKIIQCSLSEEWIVYQMLPSQKTKLEKSRHYVALDRFQNNIQQLALQ